MITTIHHATPSSPVDWYGSIMTVIVGQVVGSIVRSIDIDGSAIDEAQIHMSTDQHDGYVADVVATDPAVLRDLATVAGILADELGRTA
ncbi:hypothetical protein [Mycolicibacterium porcinum]|uniref:Uncharacterized protein n=1 Tax=Mycolicibacterium porcinum TaxID=39693 RepID=A0ABV3VQE4_9MYCO